MKVAEMRDTAQQRAGEIAENAQKAAKDLMGGAQKAAYAAFGAPMVIGRRITEYGGKVGHGLRQEIENSIAEGEKLVERLRDRNVVDELKDRMDIDQLQNRVERLRDQLEDVLASWRESFRPHPEEPAPAPEKKPTTAKKAASGTTKKAASGTTARKPASGTTAKKAAAKPQSA